VFVSGIGGSEFGIRVLICKCLEAGAVFVCVCACLRVWDLRYVCDDTNAVFPTSLQKVDIKKKLGYTYTHIYIYIYIYIYI